jgi:predicted dehydrogenase
MALRLGLVGRGRWGRNIERTLLTFPDVSVIAIARGEKPPAGLDGVLIATPSATHAEVALPYINAGVATFIEKPMTTTLADAERIRDAAERSGALVFVGHVFLFHPAVLVALELLPSVGKIRHLLCEGMNASPRTDSSVLWDWLPHDLAIARTIFDCDAESAMTWSLAGGAKPEAALVKFQFGEAPVVFTVSWLSPVRRRQVTIVCENATLIFDDYAERRLVRWRHFCRVFDRATRMPGTFKRA